MKANTTYAIPAGLFFVISALSDLIGNSLNWSGNTKLIVDSLLFVGLAVYVGYVTLRRRRDGITFRADIDRLSANLAQRWLAVFAVLIVGAIALLGTTFIPGAQLAFLPGFLLVGLVVTTISLLLWPLLKLTLLFAVSLLVFAFALGANEASMVADAVTGVAYLVIAIAGITNNID